MTVVLQRPHVERQPLLTDNESDWGTPGAQLVYDPEDAAAWGAFEEDALSEADAWDSNTESGVAEGGE